MGTGTRLTAPPVIRDFSLTKTGDRKAISLTGHRHDRTLAVALTVGAIPPNHPSGGVLEGAELAARCAIYVPNRHVPACHSFATGYPMRLEGAHRLTGGKGVGRIRLYPACLGYGDYEPTPRGDRQPNRPGGDE